MAALWIPRYLIMTLMLIYVETKLRCASNPRCKCMIKKNGSITADCSGLQLTSVPLFNKTVTSINLSHNNFSVFPKASELPATLIYLDMSRNFVSKFAENPELKRLSKLQRLDLSGNKLELNYDIYPRELFKGLNELKWINIKNNTKMIFPGNQYYPSETFSQLTSLEYLFIDGLDNRTFSEQLLRLKSLILLDLSGLTGKCSISILTSQYFVYLPYLQTVDVSYCGLLRIEEGTFQVTKFLKNLDISFNEDLTFRVLSNVTYDLQFTDIRVANASKLYRTFGTGTELFHEDIKYIRNTSLEKVYLDSNRLEVIESRLMLEDIPTTLRYLSVADNKLTFGLYVLQIDHLTSMIEFNGSHQGASHNPKDLFQPDRSQSCDKPYRKPCDVVNTELVGRSYHQINSDMMYNLSNGFEFFKFNVPKNLEIIHFHKSSLKYKIPELDFTDNKVKHIDFSANILDQWIGPVRNVNSLKYMDLSNNFCVYVSEFFFDGAVNLETLLVSNNLLGFVLNTDEGKIFKNLKHLIKLDISQNRIQYLQPKVFKGTNSLQFLNASNNLLREWDFEIGHLLHLKYIDISYNQIGLLAAVVRNNFDNLSKHTKITLNLIGNNFACTCDSSDFLKWIKNTNITLKHFKKYSCRLSNGTIVLFKHLDEVIANLNIECMSKLGLIIGTSVGILIAVSIAIGGIVYRYRWKIRYLYYMARNKNRTNIPVPECDSNSIYEYDIFVSYADDDKDFVVNEMLNNLEKDRNLRLCIHHRDFIPGIDIATNITNAIHNSRKTVVILTYNFLKSYWCRYEFNMARMEAIYSRDGRDILFLIFLKHISAKDLPLMIMDLIDSQSYIEYPDDPQGNVVFWEKIKEAATILNST